MEVAVGHQVEEVAEGAEQVQDTKELVYAQEVAMVEELTRRKEQEQEQVEGAVVLLLVVLQHQNGLCLVYL